ncbi:MAG TPA: sensor domain-containing diguanylate cyclase [Candidatus Eisenbergiella merdavium]|uniref:Sensor domain-containing diguanylate cyclase n=1 Tax=Candidatus Eisenbergiella merdavium TaxID=2838551 RepID=A0A9D2NJ06_9FIRM|nr:sensor domain-containing diguanylate cyclase [Candidatus Eisenbergiella merdavium]
MIRKVNLSNILRWGRPLAVTVLLILLIIGCSFLVTGRINRHEEANAFQRLYEEAGTLAGEIESRAYDDRRQLETIAALLSEYEDLTSPQVERRLTTYSSIGMMSYLELLLPDNTVLSPKTGRTDATGFLSFEKEAAAGAHITDRETGLSEDEGYILRHFVPVIRNGETVAMLYGVIELGSLPKELVSNPYGGEAAVYIVDGNTGDFLVDTWHAEPGNIWELGERPMAKGYDHDALKQGMIEGRTGYVVFVSRTTGSYLYFYYEPLSINSWRIALSVPEELVFADANVIRNILGVFLFLEAVCFILYFLWMLRYIRHEMDEKQHQLDSINYIYDVEKLLFNAHEQHGNIEQALENIARITSAQAVSFLMSGPEGNDSSYIFERKEPDSHPARLTPKDRASSARIAEITSRLPAYFRLKGGTHSVCGLSDLHAVFSSLRTDSVKNMIALPVLDADDSVSGVLAAFNLPDAQTGAALLKSVSFSFSMFCHNMRSYHAIRERGERDMLSGLYNRNRYEQDLKDYPSLCQRSLACIYVDANGLHELNNSEGHDAGDRMLKSVSKQLLEQFGSLHSYRIGGDEFLAFAPDLERDEAVRRTDTMRDALKQQGYHISAGIQWTDKAASLDTVSLRRLIKEAEQQMYLAKKAYYEEEGNDRRGGARR